MRRLRGGAGAKFSVDGCPFQKKLPGLDQFDDPASGTVFGSESTLKVEDK